MKASRGMRADPPAQSFPSPLLQSLERRVLCASDRLHLSVDAEGDAVLFIDRDGQEPIAVDLADASGGPAAIGASVAWFDRRTGLARAAAATERGLTVYSEVEDGSWSFDTLAESLGTGTIVRDSIASTIGPGGLYNIIGLSPEGDLIRYVQTRDGAWHEWNLSENQLESRGLTTPGFIGQIVATRTLWGGLNIAGINEDGDLVTVWTTLTVGRWFLSNLSEYTGAQTFWSGLDIVGAGRHGIHFSAVDSTGNLTILSWTPRAGGWTSSTLAGSPRMQQGEISLAFDGARRALLVTSLRLDSGALMVHMVPLSFSTPEPFRATISGFGVPAERRVRHGIDIQIGSDYLISVVGANLDGETVRFTAFEPLNTAWDFENLTEIT